MAEKDLAGFDDCDDRFTEIDVDTDEHVRHSAYWAASTGRGQDWEEPDRWADIWAYLEQSTAELSEGSIANVGSDLEETDARVKSAVYRVTPGETTQWSAEITTRSGTVVSVGPLQPLPQDVPAPDYPPITGPGASPKTFRGGAITGGWFPFWLLGPNCGRVVWSIGLVLDLATEWLYAGIKQRMPLECEEGALPWLGRDLGIARGFREATDAYRQRLARWVPTWRRAGTPFSILEQVQAYCYPSAPRVYLVRHDPGADGKPTRATWSARSAAGVESTTVTSPSNFDVDSNDGARQASLDDRDPREWLIIEQPGTDAAELFAERDSASAATRDASGANGVVRPDGSRSPADQYRDLVAMIVQWKAMGTYVAGVFVVLGTIDPSGSGASHPDGSWHDPLNDAKDGNRIPDTIRILYLDRFPGNRLPESPIPYPV